MGFSKHYLKLFLRSLRDKGITPSGRLLTLGRLHMNFDYAYFNNVCRRLGLDYEFEPEMGGGGERAGWMYDDVLFKKLGFEAIDSVDLFLYDGASLCHDLNRDVPKDWENRYDFIIDSGSIEHIFHLPNVLSNVFKLLKEDGVFVLHCPGYETLNHGYYNFSPNLFYDYFRCNKYEILQFSIVARFFTKWNKEMIYTLDTELNDLDWLTEMTVVSNDKASTLLYAMVKKTSQTTDNAIPNQGIYCDMPRDRFFKRIINEMAAKKEKSVLLYGTGEYAKGVVRDFPNNLRNRILGLLDNSPENIGKNFYGFEVLPPETIDNEKTIIICSEVFAETIYNRVKKYEETGVTIIKPDTEKQAQIHY